LAWKYFSIYAFQQVNAFGTEAADKPLQPTQIGRGAVGRHEVEMNFL
jgi:hypothetical protein